MARHRWSHAEEERVIGMVKACADVRQLKQVHAHVIASGQSQNNFLAAKLVRTFTALGHLEHARSIAGAVSDPNAFLWTALIRGYSDSGADSGDDDREALLLYARMHRSTGVRPLTFTLSSALKACAHLSALSRGMQVHAHVFKYGFQSDARVQTTLIDLYGKCGRVDEARRVFDRIAVVAAGGGRRGDVQAWNTMISAYTGSGDMDSALSMFDNMPERNTFTWVEMIAGYSTAGRMDHARGLFDTLSARGDRNPVVCTAMMMGYAKCGDVSAARSLFDEMTERDVASWNAMITCYSRAGLSDEVVNLFHLMLDRSYEVQPNRATVATVVSACAQSGSAELARWIEDYIYNHGGSELLNNYTVAALVDMHAKCGDPGRAYGVFLRGEHRDLICYSSMIAGFGIHGRGRDAIRVFTELVDAGLKPDGVCFVSVLSACSHAGLVEEGRRYFEAMRREHGVPPTADHYTCMVDMLGRAGRVEEAYRMITEEMLPAAVRPHAGVWGALLSACRTHSKVELGEEAARRLMELEPENAGNYVLLSNIYAKARRWEDVARVRALMRSRGMRKPPGCSWLEVDGVVRRFLTGEVCNLQLEMMMEVLGWELRAQGYLPRPALELD